MTMPDGDLEHRARTEDEKKEILRRARDNIAKGEDEKQQMLRRDGERTWSEDEKREILRRARENIARGDATRLTKKIEENAHELFESYKRRQQSEADDVADTSPAHFDPVQRPAGPQPQPPMGRTLDGSLDDLVAGRIETAIVGQRNFVTEVIAESIAKERRRYERQIAGLKREVESLKADHTAAGLQQFSDKLDRTLGQCAELIDRFDRRVIDIPNPLSPRRSSSVN